MEFLKIIVSFILHIDRHLDYITTEYGTLTYLILFLIIFAETGLVVTPFLPGDSLLFAIGAIAARGTLSLTWILVLLTIAAILGDTLNYWVGNYFKTRILSGEKIPLINQKHIEETRLFYAKYGGKTIIIGRFIPIVRTFAPFVAGIGTMNYSRFITFNIVGGIAWIFIFTNGGYIFGNIEVIRKNFTRVAFTIIFISVLPVIYEFIRVKLHRMKK
jgi:membrane-associated protein